MSRRQYGQGSGNGGLLPTQGNEYAWASLVASRGQITTDGHKGCLDAIDTASPDDEADNAFSKEDGEVTEMVNVLEAWEGARKTSDGAFSQDRATLLSHKRN